MERAWRKEERDLELNLRGSPQARRRQVPRPPRKTTPLYFKLPFFSPLLFSTLCHGPCPDTSVLVPLSPVLLSCPLFVHPFPAPLIIRLYFRFFTSPRFALSLSLSLSLSPLLSLCLSPPFLSLSLPLPLSSLYFRLYEHKVHRELLERSYNPWTRKSGEPLYTCVCLYICTRALINPLVIPPS